MYETVRALRDGQVVELDGIRLRMSGDGTVMQGDLYVAERNTGPKLLTAGKVVPPDAEPFGGWIQPTTIAYSYDIGECVKVEEA